MTDERIQGIAAGLAELIRLHDEPTIVKDVLDGFGLTVRDLVRAGVGRYDMAPLKAALHP